MAVATLKQADIRRQLPNKFGFEELSGNNHLKYRLWVDGKIVAITQLSHSKSDIKAGVVSAMARQLSVTSSQFVGMISCSFSKVAYFEARGLALPQGDLSTGPGKLDSTNSERGLVRRQESQI